MSSVDSDRTEDRLSSVSDHSPRTAAEPNAEPGGSAAAFFDVDGTLVSTTIVHYYMYFRRRMMGRLSGGAWQVAYYLRCLYFLILDSIDRSRMNVTFYRDYAGLSTEIVQGLADDCFRDMIEPSLFPDGVECIGEYLAKGTRVVFVTGSLDFIMAPLARSLDVADVIAAEMGEVDGRFTGELAGPPIGEQIKADRMRSFAERGGIDLTASHAYGDSVADVPMLEAVGHAHVVNPQKKLAAIARTRGWSVHHWSRKANAATPVTAR